MLIYINGDSHSAGAELYESQDGKLVSFTEDDSKYWNTIGTYEGQVAHPECVKLSYGKKLANMLDAELICDAVSGSSNERICRSTIDYLNYGFRPDLIVIGWSTWEREEWEYDGRMWQINASGVADDWPDASKQRYKEWVVNINYDSAMDFQHLKIWRLHKLLQSEDIDHIFFTCYQEFNPPLQYEWGPHYVEPYDSNYTYYNWLRNRGFKTITPSSYHFGADAHRAWAEFLYSTYVQKILTE